MRWVEGCRRRTGDVRPGLSAELYWLLVDANMARGAWWARMCHRVCKSVGTDFISVGEKDNERHRPG